MCVCVKTKNIRDEINVLQYVGTFSWLRVWFRNCIDLKPWRQAIKLIWHCHRVWVIPSAGSVLWYPPQHRSYWQCLADSTTYTTATRYLAAAKVAAPPLYMIRMMGDSRTSSRGTAKPPRRSLITMKKNLTTTVADTCRTCSGTWGARYWFGGRVVGT